MNNISRQLMRQRCPAAGISPIRYLDQLGVRVRRTPSGNLVPCPWVGGRACPTHGALKINLDSGRFACRICAPDGGDVVVYHQLVSRLSRRQVLDMFLLHVEA
jgi:hypothetical protein